MVHRTNPLWYNRSCLRFGIYSETLDDELLNRPRFQNRRIRCCVVAGMVLVTTLLVGLMVYDMMHGYGLPSREKDAVQHLLMLRRTTTVPTPVTESTVASTFATTTTTNTTSPPNTPTPAVIETTTNVMDITLLTSSLPLDISNSNDTLINGDKFLDSSENISSALPYRYIRKDRVFDSRRHGKQRSPGPYEYITVNDNSHRIFAPGYTEDNSQETSTKLNYPIHWVPPESVPLSEIQSRIMNHGIQAPRPFKAKNVSVERPANNRIKMEDNDDIPFYEFSSVNKYPQLSAYRYPNEAKNIQDIIKYLTTEEDSSSAPSSKQHNTLVFRAPNGNKRKIKFTGVYKKAEKENSVENYNDPEESMSEYTLSDHHIKIHDSSLNGHAYDADPFQAFKPSDPSEINLLANSDFRFSPIDNRIRITSSRPNGYRWNYYEANPNDKYFPRPPINFNKPPSSAQSNNHQPVVQVYPGTYTTATFKPFGKDPVISSSSTSSKKTKKVKPFSVMLDIYPMMEDSAPQATVNKGRPHRRPSHVRFPPIEHVKRPDHAADNSDSKHQMVVHLNLYPKKKKNHDFSNRNDDVHTFHVDVKDNPYCCDEEQILERYAKFFGGDVVSEELKTDYNMRNYAEDEESDEEVGGDEGMPSEFSEFENKQKKSDIKQPRGIISGDRNAMADMSKKRATLERTSILEITGSGPSRHFTNPGYNENSYASLQGKRPTTSAVGVSGNKEFSSISKEKGGNGPLDPQTTEYYLSEEK